LASEEHATLLPGSPPGQVVLQHLGGYSHILHHQQPATRTKWGSAARAKGEGPSEGREEKDEDEEDEDEGACTGEEWDEEKIEIGDTVLTVGRTTSNRDEIWLGVVFGKAPEDVTVQWLVPRVTSKKQGQWLHATNKEDGTDTDGKTFRKGDVQTGIVQYKSICTVVQWPRVKGGKRRGGAVLGTQWTELAYKYL
jgi:hypothetical protein